jgi:hypothetical protein
MNVLFKNTLRKTPIYDVYWRFAAERQNVFFNRLRQMEAPWTLDPVMIKYKFTNAYRVLDRVSQFLIDSIIKPDIKSGLSDEDILFRILLYKIFNKIETWELLEGALGELSWRTYSFQEYDNVLSSAFQGGISIYSAAYIMASGKSAFGYERKHQNHLTLLEFMMQNNFAARVMLSRSMSQLYDILLSYPLIGPFLAYQYATDINYSELTDFTEEDFVVAGPGAIDGITKCFSDIGHYSYEEVIRVMMENQEAEFDRLDLDFKSLFGRRLKLIDCQNLFCEVGKYARVSHPQIKDKSGRLKIKQIYRTSGAIPIPSFPEKWGLSTAVQTFLNTQLVKTNELGG